MDTTDYTQLDPDSSFIMIVINKFKGDDYGWTMLDKTGIKLAAYKNVYCSFNLSFSRTLIAGYIELQVHA